MEKDDIIISIITVTYNEGEKIVPTIESVLNYMSKNDMRYEYVVIDGNSTDDTLEILRSYSSLTIVSEPDNGIYDAMNKGVRLSKGRWLYFINSGDVLKSLPVEKMKRTNVDLIACPVQTETDIIYPSWGRCLMWHNSIPHQGAIYKRRAFENYDIGYKVFSDYHHNIHLYKDGGTVIISSEPVIAFHSQIGVSHSKDSLSELYLLIRREFGLLGVLATWLHFKYLGLKKRMRCKWMSF